MKKIILFLFLYFSSFVAEAQVSFGLSGYPLVTSGWAYGSSSGTPATVLDSTMRLTTTSTSIASYAYYNTAYNMAGYCEWTADFDFKITPVSGADGMAFWFLTTPPIAAAVGGGLGLPSSPNGLVLILDTYNNNSAAGADNPLITLLGYNGSTTTYVEGSAAGVIAPVVTNQNFVTDGSWHHCHVTYVSGNINVYFNYNPTPMFTAYYPLSITGYFGFSGSTGAITSTESIKSVAISLNGCLTPLNNGPLCQGDTLKLQALGDSTSATYYWYGPAGFTSTLQNPFLANVVYADSGDYHVVKTVAGVHDTGFTHVSINLSPIIIASSNSPVCVGNTISLVSGPAATGETFLWIGPGGYASFSENPTISPAAQTDSGFYSVIATQNGCKDTATVHVDVVNVPIPVASNNTPICAGGTISLIGTDAVSVSYNWSGPGGYSSALQNPSISGAVPSESGVYTLTASIGACTNTATTTVTVYAYPVVTAGSNSPVCSGNALLLTSGGAPAPGEVFSWSGPNAYSSAVANPTINPASLTDTGFYTVSATQNGCTTNSVTHVSIIHVPLPEASNNSPVCSGSTVSLTGTDTLGTVSWSWSGPGGYSSALQNPTLLNATPGQSGVYTLTATSGVCTATDTTLVTIYAQPAIPIINLVPPLCTGSTLSLTLDPASISPGAVYYWTGPNGFSSTLTAPIIPNVTTAATGLYSVYGVIGVCSTIVHTNYVQIDSTPVIPTASNNGPICSGTTLTLQSSCPTANVHYSWSGPASFFGNVQDTAVANAQANISGNYTVTVSLGICQSKSVTTVLVNQTPTLPTVNSNSPVCSGGLLILSCFSTPTGGVYTWHGPNSFNTVTQNPQINNVSVLASGIYSVYETVNGCRSDTATVTVVINPTPALPTATNNSPICQGETLQLHATDVTPGVTYTWTGPNAFTSTNSDPIIVNVLPAAQGIYTVVANLGPCSSTSITNVSITNTPTITATSNSPVCTGDTLKLFSSSTAGFAISWSGPYTFSNVAPNPIRYPAIPEYAGVYMVTVTEPGGCFATTTDTVVINQTPTLTWINWLTLCQFAYAPPLMPIDATNVLWFPSGAGGLGTTVAPTPPTDVPGVYYYYLNQTVNHCTSPIDSIQVVIHPKPTITINPTASFICPGDSVVYTTTSSDPAATYHWYPTIYLEDSLTASNVAHPIAGVNYSVIATNVYGCTDTAKTAVTVFPAALIITGVHDSIILYPGESYHILPYSNCVSYSWFPPEGLSTSSMSDPIATPPTNTIYVVTGITENGCIATDSIYFHVSEDNAYAMPNAFTPGTGVNNEFKLLAKGIAVLNHFRIYNRWGELLFETKNIDAGWDGTWKGAPQPFGVYIYDVEAVSSISGKIFKLHGNITLLR